MGKDIYRSRLDTPLNQKVLNFISSMNDDLWIAEEDIIGTEVHNIMLFEQGILNRNEIGKILKSLETIKGKLSNQELDIDFSYEDIHPFIEKCVIDDIGIEIGGKIHTGRSRNDQVSVDIRLKIRNELNCLSEKLLHMVDSLLKISEETTDTYMPLYTHLQRGQLGVLAHYINNYIAQIIRSVERIEEIYHRINKNPLGACAIGGTSININRKRTAELLGFEGVIQNSIDAISSRDYIYETLMCLSLISTQFSRISADLLIWSTKEFGFVELDDQYCSVSSVMPQKKNADTLELIRSKSSKIIGNMFSSSVMIKGIPSGYFKDFQELKGLLQNSIDTTFLIIDILTGIFSTIKINKDAMLKVIKESYILALDIAERLVQDYNIPFRISHRIIASIVRDSKNPDDIFNKENLENSILKEYKKKISLSNSFIDSLKDYRLCLEKRISEGSPSKLEVKKAIESLQADSEGLKTLLSQRATKISNAKQLRENLIIKLIE